MSKKKWMQKAVKKENKGKFTAKAKKAGMGVQEYAEKVMSPESKASTTTKREANLAQIFARVRKEK